MINLYGPTVIANTISKQEMTKESGNEQRRGEDNFGFDETELGKNDDDDDARDWVRHRWITAKENVSSLQALAIASNSSSRKNSMASVVSSNSRVTKVDLEEQKEGELCGIFTAAVKARRESTQWSLVKDGEEAMQALIKEKQSSTRKMWTKILDDQKAEMELGQKLLLDKGEVMRDLHRKTSALKAMKRRRESEAPLRCKKRTYISQSYPNSGPSSRQSERMGSEVTLARMRGGRALQENSDVKMSLNIPLFGTSVYFEYFYIFEHVYFE